MNAGEKTFQRLRPRRGKPAARFGVFLDGHSRKPSGFLVFWKESPSQGARRMSRMHKLARSVLFVVIAVSVAVPVSATTLIRQSLENLVKANGRIVVGDVLDTYSYWNQDGSEIMTDVRFLASEVLKGGPADMEFTITVPGGWIGDQGIVIVGGAELVPGHSYLLFLNETKLRGGARALMVRDLSQGAFDLKAEQGGVRAVSQAVHHPLLPDKSGQAEPPGGKAGIPYEMMVQSIRELVERQGSRREVQ
jgi:hypothetical protein